MRPLALGLGLALVAGGCNCLTLAGATCTNDDECGGLGCIGGFCGGRPDPDAGNPGVSELRFVNAASRTSGTQPVRTLQVDAPAGADAGDLLVTVFRHATIDPVVVPDGWTQLDAYVGSRCRLVVFEHVLAPGEGSWTFGYTPDGGPRVSSMLAGIAAYRNTRGGPISVLQHSAAHSDVSRDGGVTVPHLTVGADHALAVVGLTYDTSSGAPPTWTAPANLDKDWDDGFTAFFSAPAPRGDFVPGPLTVDDRLTACGADLALLVLVPQP